MGRIVGEHLAEAWGEWADVQVAEVDISIPQVNRPSLAQLARNADDGVPTKFRRTYIVLENQLGGCPGHGPFDVLTFLVIGDQPDSGATSQAQLPLIGMRRVALTSNVDVSTLVNTLVMAFSEYVVAAMSQSVRERHMNSASTFQLPNLRPNAKPIPPVTSSMFSCTKDPSMSLPTDAPVPIVPLWVMSCINASPALNLPAIYQSSALAIAAQVVEKVANSKAKVGMFTSCPYLRSDFVPQGRSCSQLEVTPSYTCLHE